MNDPEDISEDRGFKALFSSYPNDTFAVFMPQLIAERGKPSSATVIQQECPLPDLGDPSRFLDIALLAAWSDGYQAVILLVEHWSEARKIDLRRVNWYVADLALRHPKAVVYPAVLVTDPSAKEVSDRFEMAIAGRVVLSLQVEMVRITIADLPRLRIFQNRVAAILAVLAVRNANEAIDALITCVQDMARAPGPLDDVERFLPFAMKLARLPESDAPRFRRRLEEAGMVNPITEIKNDARAEGLAEGLAEGEAKGKIAEIRRLVAKGRLTVDAARSEIEELMTARAIPEAVGREALGQLG